MMKKNKSGIGKWVELALIIVCFVTLAGCDLDFSSNDNQSNEIANIDSYTDINHSFLKELLGTFETGEDEVLLEAAPKLKGAIGTAIKIIGKVAQIAGKVKEKKNKADFQDEVLGDLQDIKEELDGLDNKVTAGFSQILSKVTEGIFLDEWNSMSDTYLTPIDTVWGYYLNDAGTGLLDKLSNKDLSVENMELYVTNFISQIQDYEDTLQDALTNIEHHVSGTNSFSKILCQYGDYLSVNNSAEFADPDVMDTVLSQYLYLYTNLLFYQIKATTLLNEFYNYQVDSDEVVLNEDGYQTVTSEDAKDQNRELHFALKNGLGVFLNTGERLISQFNAGDIYRRYSTRETAIRNSGWYPYIDAFISAYYGYDDVLVFRLVWSEEAGTNDPDAWLEDKTVTGEYGYNYEYQPLFDDLKNKNNALDFFLLGPSDEKYADPVTDVDFPDNLTTISLFSLHPRGSTAKNFQAGARRYVFADVDPDASLTLTYESSGIDTYYDFKYSHGDFPYHNSDVKEKRFTLYEPGSVVFTMNSLLDENDPLSELSLNAATVSYTFGAYLTSFEYLAEANTLFDSSKTYEDQIKALYCPFDYGRFNVETSGNQHIETTFNKANCGFTIVPDDIPDDEDLSTPICDGQEVVVYMMYTHHDKEHHGYMYQPTTKSGKSIKFKEGKDKAIRFNIEKKYIFPSGKLFSDEVIKQYNYFMLTKGDLCTHAVVTNDPWRDLSDAYLLEYDDDNAFSMSNWLFLNSVKPWPWGSEYN